MREPEIHFVHRAPITESDGVAVRADPDLARPRREREPRAGSSVGVTRDRDPDHHGIRPGHGVTDFAWFGRRFFTERCSLLAVTAVSSHFSIWLAHQ